MASLRSTIPTGTEVVLFSPAEEMRENDAVVMKNLQAMQVG